MSKPRPITAEEARKRFLDHIRMLVNYWNNESRRPTAKEKLEGLAFSILNIIDGTSAGHPSMDLVLRPHPEDEAYHRAEGENWSVNGQVINEGVMLHEHWHQ